MFQQYSYSSQPIIIKKACAYWPARKHLSFKYLKDLYYKSSDALNRFNDECQFLPFKSSFATLGDFFKMPDSQVNIGKPPWYIGFSNCNPNILKELRKLYPRPHFLPKDAEIPNIDYTFLGYEEGATMHVRFFLI